MMKQEQNFTENLGSKHNLRQWIFANLNITKEKKS